mgnify:CR=1 FL=1
MIITGIIFFSLDILIGLDQYWRFVKPEIVPVSESLVIQNTMFGWMLSGMYELAPSDGRLVSVEASPQLFCVQGVSDDELRGIRDLELEDESRQTDPVLSRFNETIRLKEGRYEVQLPWKGNAGQLVDNFRAAELRLRSLSRKLVREPDLKIRYDQALEEMETNKVVEEVPPEEMYSMTRVFYMPHRPVVKETSASTKVRPVFNASAKDGNGLSLNDCLATGPKLIPSLIEILIRFRRWRIALAADIQKAFLQIGIRKEDQDVHRFLWEVGNKVRVMRFVRVPFGNKSSPFILNATIKYHLSQCEPSKVVSELEENLYVDDFLTGADEEAEATRMIQEADQLMKGASMNLTKWGSNNREVHDLSDKCELLCNVKVLGLGWSPEEDCFMFEGSFIDSGLVVTKRIVLSLIARLFDPLGFLNPFVISLKCLFQSLWRTGIGWDEKVSEEFESRVVSWVKDLEKLKTWRVSRTYHHEGWKGSGNLQLLAYGDASESVMVPVFIGELYSSFVLS